MNKKGFILVDSLICILIVSVISVLALEIFVTYNNYLEGYANYQQDMARGYENIFNDLEECEKCVIEEDSPPQDY